MNALQYYNDSEAIEYVGWLLACASGKNLAKGEALLNDLPSDKARTSARLHGEYLTHLYEGGLS